MLLKHHFQKSFLKKEKIKVFPIFLPEELLFQKYVDLMRLVVKMIQKKMKQLIKKIIKISKKLNLKKFQILNFQ